MQEAFAVFFLHIYLRNGDRPVKRGHLCTLVGTGSAWDAPPLFFLCAVDDALAVNGSVEMHKAWKAAGKDHMEDSYMLTGRTRIGEHAIEIGLPFGFWI